MYNPENPVIKIFSIGLLTKSVTCIHCRIIESGSLNKAKFVFSQLQVESGVNAEFALEYILIEGMNTAWTDLSLIF